jgi:hypothetical protein
VKLAILLVALGLALVLIGLFIGVFLPMTGGGLPYENVVAAGAAVLVLAATGIVMVRSARRS